MSGNLHAVVLIALAISTALSATDITCKGCLPLDEFNFENVVPRFKAVLVKFDVPYPYGEGHEEWRKFAEDVWGVDDLLLAEVPVRFHGAKDNEGLAKKYGAKGKGDLPLVRLFVGDPKKSYRLKDDLTVYGLKNLLREKADVKIHLEGCLEEYDRIAADFISGREDREEKLEGARRRAENSKPEGAADDMEAANNRYKKSTNPFEEGDDVDDDTFLRNSRRPPPPPLQSAYGEIQSLQERRKEIEDRTLQSTESSIRILRESERIGIETGEELMRQREQLERTDERLDEINATLRFSQKHINGIKSVFSSLKNFVSGKKDVASPTSVPSSDSSKISTSNLEQKVSSYDRYENHPATRLRSGEEAREEASGSKNISAKLEANLQEMSTTVSILKELATGLSYEIDSQNDLIGGITDKAEQADATIQKQNKEVQKILRK